MIQKCMKTLEKLPWAKENWVLVRLSILQRKQDDCNRPEQATVAGCWSKSDRAN